MKNSIVYSVLIPINKALVASSVQVPFKRWLFLQSCFTSTENKRTIRDRETRMATSTHTAPELWNGCQEICYNCHGWLGIKTNLLSLKRGWAFLSALSPNSLHLNHPCLLALCGTGSARKWTGHIFGVCDLLYGHPLCSCTCQRVFLAICSIPCEVKWFHWLVWFEAVSVCRWGLINMENEPPASLFKNKC